MYKYPSNGSGDVFVVFSFYMDFKHLGPSPVPRTTGTREPRRMGEHSFHQPQRDEPEEEKTPGPAGKLFICIIVGHVDSGGGCGGRTVPHRRFLF